MMLGPSDLEVNSRIHRTNLRLQQLQSLKHRNKRRRRRSIDTPAQTIRNSLPSKESDLLEPDDSDSPIGDWNGWKAQSAAHDGRGKRIDLIRNILRSTGRGCPHVVNYERKHNRTSTGIWTTHFSNNASASCVLELKRSILKSKNRARGNVTISVAPGVQGTPCVCEVSTSKHPDFGFSLLQRWDIERPVSEGIFQDLPIPEERVKNFITLAFHGTHDKVKSQRINGINIYLDFEDGSNSIPIEPYSIHRSQSKYPRRASMEMDQNEVKGPLQRPKRTKSFSNLFGKLYRQVDEAYEDEVVTEEPSEYIEKSVKAARRPTAQTSPTKNASYSSIHLGEEPKQAEPEELKQEEIIRQKPNPNPVKTSKKRKKPQQEKHCNNGSQEKTLKPLKVTKPAFQIEHEDTSSPELAHNQTEESAISLISHSTIDPEHPLMIPIDKSYTSPAKGAIISDGQWAELLQRVSTFRTSPIKLQSLSRSEDDILKFELNVPVSESEGYGSDSAPEDKESELEIDSYEDQYRTIHESSIQRDTNSEFSDSIAFQMNEHLDHKNFAIGKNLRSGMSKLFDQLYSTDQEDGTTEAKEDTTSDRKALDNYFEGSLSESDGEIEIEIMEQPYFGGNEGEKEKESIPVGNNLFLEQENIQHISPGPLDKRNSLCQVQPDSSSESLAVSDNESDNQNVIQLLLDDSEEAPMNVAGETTEASEETELKNTETLAAEDNKNSASKSEADQEVNSVQVGVEAEPMENLEERPEQPEPGPSEQYIANSNENSEASLVLSETSESHSQHESAGQEEHMEEEKAESVPVNDEPEDEESVASLTDLIMLNNTSLEEHPTEEPQASSPPKEGNSQEEQKAESESSLKEKHSLEFGHLPNSLHYSYAKLRFVTQRNEGWMQFLKEGVVLSKFTFGKKNRSTANKRVIRLCKKEKNIILSKKSFASFKKVIPLSSIKWVVYGPFTSSMRKHGYKSPLLCFSLVCQDRVYDFEAKDTNHCDVAILGIQSLIYESSMKYRRPLYTRSTLRFKRCLLRLRNQQLEREGNVEDLHSTYSASNSNSSTTWLEDLSERG